MSTDVLLIYELLLAQMAAECYFEGVPLNDEDLIKDSLNRGNNRIGFDFDNFTRFTAQQASEFWNLYQIVHQASDNQTIQPRTEPVYYDGTAILANSGLSATLLRKKAADGNLTNEYVLSIRATEYDNEVIGGDAQRDRYGADLFGIVANGLALAQLATLEEYYVWLKSGNDPLLPIGATISVTGYSLGGHLATAFTEMHANDADVALTETVTFNGAGRGTWDDASSSLSDIVTYYVAVRDDPNAGFALFENSPIDPLDYAALYARYSQALVYTVADVPLDPLSIYDDPRHLWAQAATKQRFGLNSISFFDQGPDELTNGAESIITQIYGKEFQYESTAVSNSGVHGTAVGVFSEAQPFIEGEINGATDWGNGHSIILVADSLALMRVFQEIDPTLSLSDLNALFAAMSDEYAKSALPGSSAAAKHEENSLENALDALRKLFLGSWVAPTNYNPGSGGFADLGARNGYYDNIDELVTHERFNSVKEGAYIATLVGVADTTIAALAKPSLQYNADQAYRYALQTLNPFVVIGADYSIHNENGYLDTYSPEDESGSITNQWIEDRAADLAARISAFSSNYAGISGYYDRVYSDLETDTEVFVSTITDTAPENKTYGKPVLVENASRFVFGSGGGDILSGSEQEDHLYGNDGNDLFVGRDDDDYLEGGLGLDVYQYDGRQDWIESSYIYSNDGVDTILDVDGRGVLRHVLTDSLSLVPQVSYLAGTGIKVSDSQWKSADGRILFTLVATPDPLRTLRVDVLDQSGGTIFLADWEDGDFFIRLQDARLEFVTTTSIFGDFVPVDDDTDTPELELRYDTLGNVEITDVPDPGREDVLFGDRPTTATPPSTAGEQFDAGAGNDLIFADRPNGAADNGLGNADWIKAGEGRDWIEAGAGNDLIEGGGGGVIGGALGGEVIDAGPGDDQIYSGQKIELSQAIADGKSGSSLGLKGDFSYGGAGDDWMVGSGRDDVLNGGEGRDLIVAGAGDDVIDGDVREWATTFLWNVTRTLVVIDERHYDYVVNIDGSELPDGQDPDEGGDDTIYAGAGSDVIYGRGGNDFIDAGADDDFVFGGAGEDVVIGDDGDDLLAGDGPVTGANDSSDYLDGGAGNDILLGGGGDDFLVGGKGNDILDGGIGADVYLFDRGDGADIFRDSGEDAKEDPSVFVFGDGIKRADIKFLPGSLIIDLGPSVPDDPTAEHDMIHVEGFDANDPFSTPIISSLYFADGDVMSFEEIVAQGFEIVGTEFSDNGNDELYPILVGTEIRDRISGLAGDDVLVGLGGDDVLDGGDGSDELRGGAGDDHYLIDASDNVVDSEGSNTLEFVDDTTLADIQVTKTTEGGGTPYLGLYVGTHTILGIDPLQPAFVSIAFNDGTELTYEELLGAALSDPVTLIGTAGNDTLAGHAGNDQLSGLDGNDILRGYRGDDSLSGGAGIDRLVGGAGSDDMSGGEGSDIYEFAVGDGQDLIVEDGDTADIDVVSFGEGISSADVTLERLANGILSISLSSGDGIEVVDYYNNARAKIEALVFSDGTSIDATALDALEVPPIVGTDGNDTLTGTNWTDTIEGLAGDDVIDGGGGSDTLIGGEGLDRYVLTLGSGADTLIDVSAEGSIIELGADLSFDSLSAHRDADDLKVDIRGTADAATINNFYSTPQTWSVEDSSGQTITVDSIVQATEAREADHVQALWDDFIFDTKAGLRDYYVEFEGYKFVNVDQIQFRRFEGDTFVADVHRTDETITTYRQDTVTGETLLVSNQQYNYEYWELNKPYVFVSTIDIVETLSLTDDAEIYFGDAGSNQSSSTPVILSVDWSQPIGSTKITVNQQAYASGDYIYTTTDRIASYSGGATGRIEGFSNQPPDAAGNENHLSSDPAPANVPGVFNEEHITYVIEQIIAGDLANVIYGSYRGLVDAGGGDDIVNGVGFQFGGEGNDLLQSGSVLLGGSGDDRLIDGQYLEGGDGSDWLQGYGSGAVFAFRDGESGIDLVIDQSYFTNDYAAWYCGTQLGIPEWEFRYDYGGGYLVTGDWFDSADFVVDQAVADWLLDPSAGIESHPEYDEWWSERDIEDWLGTKSLVLADPSLISYVEPLPDLPITAANDFGALLPLYEAGVLPAADYLDLPESVTQAALFGSASLVELLLENPYTGYIEPYAALDVSMNDGQSALVVIPHADDGIGSGVEYFRFGDGSVVSIQDVLDALAVAPNTLDPQDLDNVIEVTSSDAYVYADDSGYAISGQAGDDRINGSGFDDLLFGDAGNDVLMGNAGGDELHGGEGNDDLEGGSGNDALYGEIGDDTYHFGAGTGDDFVYEDSGVLDTVRVADGFTATDLTLARNGSDLTLGLNGGADRMTVVDWFSLPDRIEQIVFGDGTAFDELAIAAATDHTISVFDEQVSLLEDDSPVYGNVLDNDFSSEAGATLRVTSAGGYAGSYGALSLNEDGSYAFSLDSNTGQSLAEGEMATDVFYYDVEDDLLTSGSASLRFDITGQNDVSVIGAADVAGAVTEGATAVVSIPAGESILVNGGFETGDSTGWIISNSGPYGFSTFVGDWTPHTGDYAVIGGAVNVADLVEQRVSTVSGASYVLELWLRTNIVPVGLPSAFHSLVTVEWGGQTLLSIADEYFADYQKFEFELTGTGAEESLVIGLQNDIDFWLLDDVSLTGSGDIEIVPEFQSASGVISFTDVDASDSHVVSIANQGTSYLGTFEAQLIEDSTGGATGSIEWDFSVANAEIAFLGEGQSLTQSYDVIIDDGHSGGVATQTVTITINGAGAGLNSAPVAADDTIEAQEDGGPVVLPFTSLLANDTDADAGDTLTVTSVSATASGASIVLGADAITYDPGTLFQSLRAGEVHVDSFTYSIEDSFGESATATVTVNVAGANDQPRFVTPLEDQNAIEDTGFVYAVPVGAFEDVDSGEVLTLSATLEGGEALPAWLKFDLATQSFSGTPANDDVGSIDIRVTATDLSGESASDVFRVSVENVNDAPVVANALLDLSTDEDLPFSFQVPADTFDDVDAGDTLAYSATLEGVAALPAWLTFDAANRTFSGTPGNSDVGELAVEVTATDLAGAAASDTFALQILNVNDAPVAADDAISAVEDGGPVVVAFATLLGNDVDIDSGDVLTVSAVSASAAGAAVTLGKNALIYDPGALFQELAEGEAVIDTFTYTAQDLAGATSTALVSVIVTGVNDAPQVVAPIAGADGTELQTFSYALDPAAFFDIDHGDALVLSARSADGAPLPAWLTFDAATGLFNGFPGAADGGSYLIRVTATDTAGAEVFDDFFINVADSLAGPGGISGTGGSDVLNGLAGDDALFGNDGDDTIFGGAGNDVLDGGSGSDLMAGGEGDDTYYVGNSPAPGLAKKELDIVIELASEGWDTVYSLRSYTLGDQVESLVLGGNGVVNGIGNALDNVIIGNERVNELDGLEGNDYLFGADGADILRGGDGLDILQGGDKADFVGDVAGTSLFDGGDGADVLAGNSDNSIVIGGAGADRADLGAGHDIVLYNLGDGQDEITAKPGGSDTLSLGGGINYSDLTLRKLGNDLVLRAGPGQTISFEDWYAAPENQSFANLQVIAEAMAEFDAASSDPLFSSKVQTFDFRAIVDAFDEARAGNGRSQEWDVMDSLLDAHLAGSNTEALGGDIAYRYGLSGSLAGIGVGAVQEVLNGARFGTDAQTLRPLEELQQGRTRLS